MNLRENVLAYIATKVGKPVEQINVAARWINLSDQSVGFRLDDGDVITIPSDDMDALNTWDRPWERPK